MEMITGTNVLHSAEDWKLYAVWGAAALVPALLLSLLVAVLCLKKRKRSSAKGHSSTGESGQRHSASDRSGRVASDDQDNIHYGSVVFKRSHTQKGSLSPRPPPDTTEEEDVQYAAVNFSRNSAATKRVPVKAAHDPSQIYSMIHRIPTSAV